MTAFALTQKQRAFARQVRAPRIYEGASEIQRTIIARELSRVSELCGEGVAGPGVVGDLSGWGLAWPYGRKSGGEELAAEPGEHVGGAGLGLGGVPRA
jgi:hypothetical protein